MQTVSSRPTSEFRSNYFIAPSGTLTKPVCSFHLDLGHDCKSRQGKKKKKKLATLLGLFAVAHAHDPLRHSLFKNIQLGQDFRLFLEFYREFKKRRLGGEKLAAAHY